MRLGLILCAIDRHEYGRITHDDVVDRWIQICRRCSAVEKVDAPRDENGMTYTSHEWLELENERSSKELAVIIEQYKRD